MEVVIKNGLSAKIYQGVAISRDGGTTYSSAFASTAPNQTTVAAGALSVVAAAGMAVAALAMVF